MAVKLLVVNEYFAICVPTISEISTKFNKSIGEITCN